LKTILMLIISTMISGRLTVVYFSMHNVIVFKVD